MLYEVITLADPVGEAVESALGARGYRKAEGEEADFAVRYEVVSREIVRDSPVYIGGGYGYRYYGVITSYSIHYAKLYDTGADSGTAGARESAT